MRRGKEDGGEPPDEPLAEDHMLPQDEEAIANFVAQARGGDIESFNALVQIFQGAAYTVAARILGDRELAADATQDAVISAYRHIKSFRGTSFRVWLLRIVTNQCLDVLRARGRRPTVSLDRMLDPAPGTALPVGDLGALVDASGDPAAIAEQHELTLLLQRGLLTLPEDQRVALVLCDVEGLSYDAIAEITQTNVGTVKSRISRGRARLRDFLDQHGELLPRSYRRSHQSIPLHGEPEDTKHD